MSLRHLAVPHQPDGCRVNPVGMPRDQFGEGLLRTPGREFPEERRIGLFASHLHSMIRCSVDPNGYKKLTGGFSVAYLPRGGFLSLWPCAGTECDTLCYLSAPCYLS